MRSLLFFILSAFLLTACAPTSAPAIPENGQITPLVQASPISTKPEIGVCTDIRAPTPDPNEKSLFQPVSAQDHITGAADASVTILVYSDFQCTSCASLAPLLKSFVEKYPNDVRVVFRNFPLISIDDKAALSAQAAEAANFQGKFWEMHDLLFSRQAEWAKMTPSDFQNWVIQQSSVLGLDKSRFETDLTSPINVSNIQKAWEDGQKINLPGTPVILINGEIIKWQANLFDQLEILVKLAMLPKKQFGQCPPVIIDPNKQYIAVLKTSKGEVRIKLFVDKAPNTVNNFVFLAKQGWFNDNPFIRVGSGQDVQTGDPSGTGLGGPGYLFPNEKNNLLYDRSGIVGMANTGPDTNGSQFFITLEPAPSLNHNYTIFGEVISGVDVLGLINPQNPMDTKIQNSIDTLISVNIEEK